VKSLAQVAIVGLERAGELIEDPAGDPLLAALAPPPPREQAFLLRLGIAALRARAGRKATPAKGPEPAPAETRPPCSDPLARLVAELCRGRHTLLAEAVARIDLCERRLPPSILVDFAQVKDAGLQPAAGRVAGARGRWLAAHNLAWRWLIEGETALATGDRRRLWEEGALPSRLAVLRALRGESPGEGRSWLEAVWKEEKAAVREALLAALETNLSPDDEPFLARAVGDRAVPVRATAVDLLARLPGSALAARMRVRAEGLLSFDAPGGGLLGGLRARLGQKGNLIVTPPEAFGADWAADGIVEKPPEKTGEKAFWIAQLLALVPPAHWEERLAASPDTLIAAAKKSDWAGAVMAGWSRAVVRFRAASWVPALWRERVESTPERLSELAPPLLALVTSEQAEALVAPLLEGAPTSFSQPLAVLPRPWSDAFGSTFMGVVEREVGKRPAHWQDAFAWRSCLERAAAALPASCFARGLAVEGPQVPDDPAALQLRGAVEIFRSTLTIRKRIHEETSP
jgi:hypothetical protein